MKPAFVIINWSRGELSGTGDTEAEAREQLEKCLKNSERFRDSYLLAEVRVLSEMKRIES